MELRDVLTMAYELMSQHKLDHWCFGFDSAKRRAGCCNYRKKRISVSTWFAQSHDVDEVRDTILHEIAHALTPRAGHGPLWRAMARTIGARPQACCEVADDKAPAYTWHTVCTKCKQVTCKTYRRRSQSTIARRKSNCCGASLIQVKYLGHVTIGD